MKFLNKSLCVCAALFVSTLVHAEDVVIKVDPVALIKQASTKYQGKFKTSERDAVAQMDGMLTQQYMSRGRIATERNAYLKNLYYQAATLLMNGYPIAGGTIVSVAKNDQAFSSSPVGVGMVSFIDAMLQPTDDDEDLLAMQEQTRVARQAIQGIRTDLKFYAHLLLVGTIYHDDIAIDAGKLGLKAMKASKAEMKVIQDARKAITQ